MDPTTTNEQIHQRVLYNWLLHDLYTTGKYTEALALVDSQVAATGGASEYAYFVKGLILRARGSIAASLAAFKAAADLNPRSPHNAKQVARSLFLLGRHAAARDAFDAAQTLAIAAVRADAAEAAAGSDAAKGKKPQRVSRAARSVRERGDWEIWHNRGLCSLYLNDLDDAAVSFGKANGIQRHDITYMMLSKLAQLRGDSDAAERLLQEALEYSPENPELLTTLGQLYMADNDELRAFDLLGKSLSHHQRDPDTLLAAASVIQANGDYDGALAKLRAVAVLDPNSPQLWNNVGMCFFGKSKAVAAIACLKRALFLAPFEWLINYNLGVVHLSQHQHASAFHFLNAAVRLNPDLAAGFMYLGVTLAKLNDFDNAATAYQKALDLADSVAQDPQTSVDVARIALNFAITCHRFGHADRAHDLLISFTASHTPASLDPDIADTLRTMRAIYIDKTTPPDLDADPHADPTPDVDPPASAFLNKFGTSGAPSTSAPVIPTFQQAAKSKKKSSRKRRRQKRIKA